MNDGPTVKLELSCFDCKHVRTESYQVQGDSGTEVYCQHPDRERPGYVGDTHWRTPTWCPLRAAAITEAVKPLGFVSVDSIKGVPLHLECPICKFPHIDKDEWATRPHKTHLCEFCGHEWRPAMHYTVGVAK